MVIMEFGDILPHRANKWGVGKHSSGEPHTLLARGRIPHPTVDPRRGLLATL